MKTTTSLRFDDSSAQGSRRAPRGMCARLEGRQFDGLDRDGGAGYLAECGSESPSLYLH